MPDPRQFIVISDDMFIVIALPEAFAMCLVLSFNRRVVADLNPPIKDARESDLRPYSLFQHHYLFNLPLHTVLGLTKYIPAG